MILFLLLFISGVEETLAEETARKVKSGDAYLTPDGETVELEEVEFLLTLIMWGGEKL